MLWRGFLTACGGASTVPDEAWSAAIRAFITLRRLKGKINLPARTDEVIRLDFSPEEQQVYDWFSKMASERVRVLTGQAIGQDRIVGGKTMIHILRSILQLHQICARWYCAAKMMNGGMAQPRALTPWITVAYTQLPGWASFALLQPSEVVTTMPVKIMPIINPVSSKL